MSEFVPGWYRGPEWPEAERYWDGSTWTEAYRSPQGPSDSAPPTPARLGAAARFTRPLVVATLSTLLIAVGSVGTWVKVGSLASVSGTDSGRDGLITLVLAAVAALCVWLRYAKPTSGAPVGLIIIGLLVVVVGAYDVNDVSSRHTQIFGNDVSPSVGWGLWLVAAAGVAVILSAVALLREKKGEHA